jgi:hypothetical protein
MAPVRRGGRATTPDGGRLTWTQAEGARGTRWREALAFEGRLVRSLLLEVTTAGRPSRLEVTTRAGLLTLHPESDERAIHGNLVGGDEVRHLAFGWSPEHELLMLDSSAAVIVTLGRLADRLVVGARRTVDVLEIDDDLVPRPAQWSFERVARHAWHLRDDLGRMEWRLTLDEDGRPVLRDAVIWPLEA